MKLAISSHLRVGKTGDIGASTEAKTNKHWIFFHHPQSSHVSTRVVFHRFSIESEAKVPKTLMKAQNAAASAAADQQRQEMSSQADTFGLLVDL